MADITQFGILLALAGVILAVVSKFIPELGFPPSIGLFLAVIVIAIFIAFTLVRKQFALDGKKDVFGLVIVGVILVLLMLFGLGFIGGDFFQGTIIEIKSVIGGP